MTNTEFIDEFDVLYNSITSNKAPSLNTYEKSVFLTKAQYEIVKNYFEESSNKIKKGFDGSPKRQADFNTLIRNIECEESINSTFDNKSHCFKYPEDLFIILNEQLIQGDTIYVIAPVDYSTYDRIMAKAYKYPPIGTAWRLITNINDTPHIEVRAMLLTNESLQYKIRYVKRPVPIILEDLTNLQEDLTIEGEYKQTECELPKELHPEVLQRGVELAKIAWANDVSATLQAGTRSE